MTPSSLRRGQALKDVLVGVIFMVTLVSCIALVLLVLLHTDWWPIFSVLLSIPLGYVLALLIFGFGGALVRGIFKPIASPPEASASPPQKPTADGGERQPEHHD